MYFISCSSGVCSCLNICKCSHYSTVETDMDVTCMKWRLLVCCMEHITNRCNNIFRSLFSLSGDRITSVRVDSVTAKKEITTISRFIYELTRNFDFHFMQIIHIFSRHLLRKNIRSISGYIPSMWSFDDNQVSSTLLCLVTKQIYTRLFPSLFSVEHFKNVKLRMFHLQLKTNIIIFHAISINHVRLF